jgi:CysZ protein
VLNAVLLGRDLGEMVAVRHLDRSAARDWVRGHRWQLSLLGLVVTGLFLVPIANLLAPILGAGAATHLFHGRVR